ncbi:TatD family hydrolase [Rheinheimera texasensis]|uniref:TatD family hydrolase n=1 Tax=Rheinheimera texasensis TaxID=306205 RepID=UPI0004E248BD|nr:TatD family hydrolase [Rheinheimera texasensis]
MPLSVPVLFDTHCHLDLPELAAELQAVLAAAVEAGVGRILVPAVEAARWRTLLQLQQQTAELKFELALGIHPWWAESATEQQLAELASLLQTEAGICAVGEIGLDFARSGDDDAATQQRHQWQQKIFSAQLALAAQVGKPVVLHHRKSQPALLAELKRQQFCHGGILHAFSGSQAQAHAFLDQGFKLGIGGTISYERAQKTRDTVKKLPLSALVLETDAPAMPLAGFQGQVNTPAQLALVFQHLCLLRPESPAVLAEALWQNSLSALQLPV